MFSPLPNYFIIPFTEYYNDIQLELEFFEDNGIDPGLLFSEVIYVISNNVGFYNADDLFEDMDYVWISLAYDTFLRNGGSDDADDLQLFSSIYGSVVEKIFLCINSDIESIIMRYGTRFTFLVEFANFIGKDLLLKITTI